MTQQEIDRHAEDPRSFEHAVEHQRTRAPALVRVRAGWTPNSLARQLARTDPRVIEGTANEPAVA